jgi:hypothetical protein
VGTDPEPLLVQPRCDRLGHVAVATEVPLEELATASDGRLDPIAGTEYENAEAEGRGDLLQGGGGLRRAFMVAHPTEGVREVWEDHLEDEGVAIREVARRA